MSVHQRNDLLIDLAFLAVHYGLYAEMKPDSFSETVNELVRAINENGSQMENYESKLIGVYLLQAYVQTSGAQVKLIENFKNIKTTIVPNFTRQGYLKFPLFRSLVTKIIKESDSSFDERPTGNDTSDLNLFSIGASLVSEKNKSVIYFRDPIHWMFLAESYDSFEKVKMKVVNSWAPEYKVKQIDYVEVRC